jgi:transient receptor potential cation channel subfamily V protein 5
MLIAFPKILHEIYLSEEYYGENVLHMGCVAEDDSLVKLLLDIGSDILRYNSNKLTHFKNISNFFCCDDQKAH